MNKKQLVGSLKSQGFSDKIVSSFEKMDRERFIPIDLKKYAYEDVALEIGQGQTISQPYTIAFMLELLELGDDGNFAQKDNLISNFSSVAHRDAPTTHPKFGNQIIPTPDSSQNRLPDNLKILEVGSGSGYVLALLNGIVNGKIYGVERLSVLVEKSRETLRNLKNVEVFEGDGSKGLEKFAPFDRVLVSASADKVPEKLIKQLKVGGILVIPVKESIFQIRKTKNGLVERKFPGFVFVPLVEKRNV